MRLIRYKDFLILNIFRRFKVLMYVNKMFGFKVVAFYDKKNKRLPWYIRQFYNEVLLRLLEKREISVLGLGLGVGYISSFDKSWKVDYVEEDVDVVSVAKKYFGLPKNTKVYLQDVKDFLDDENSLGLKYDVIFYDLFDDNKMVYDFLEDEYLLKIKKFLNRDGIIIVNIGDTYFNTNKHVAKLRDNIFRIKSNSFPIFNVIVKYNTIVVIENNK